MNRIELVKTLCPYCGEAIEVLIDCSLELQSYIEDCQVCCRPIDFNVVVDEQGIPAITVSSENEI